MVTAVTGASGHVGANLVRALIAQGRAVRVLVRSDHRAFDGLDVEQVHGDVTDPNTLARLVDGAEIVHHLAARITLAYHRDALATQINVGGTQHVVDACLRARVKRLVHYSSIHAFDAHPVAEPVTESRVMALGADVPIYDRTKAEAENIVRGAITRGLDAVIVNPTAIIGPNDFKPSAMGKLLCDLFTGRVPALVRGGFNWVDVRDVVDGALLAEAKGRAGENYLLGGHYATFQALTALTASVGGARAPRWFIPVGLAAMAVPFAAIYTAAAKGTPTFTRASLRAITHHQDIRIDKACTELGYAPRPFVDTLRDTHAWFRDSGALATKQPTT